MSKTTISPDFDDILPRRTEAGGIQDLACGWKVMEIGGRGVIVVAGSAGLFIEDVKIEGGQLVDASAGGLAAPVRVNHGPSSIAEVNVTALRDELRGKNLTSAGTYGATGPLLEKLGKTLKDAGPDSPLVSPLGAMLALGDHGRFGAVAAVIEMSPERRTQFSALLDEPDAEKIEEFADQYIAAA